MTNDPILKPPYLKIGRAKEHIRDLTREIDAYLADRPARLMIRDDPATNESTRFIKNETAIPDSISLIAGDAIHNLRTALDLIVFAIVGDKTKAPQQVQFPWAWAAEKLEATIAQRQMRHAGKHVIDAIKALKPYKGGNPALEILHLLDITDKHKLILTTASSVEMNLAEFVRFIPIPGLIAKLPVDKGRSRWRIADTAQFIFPGLKRRQTDGPPTVREYEAEVQPPFQICFGEGLPAEGRPMLTTLLAICEYVEGACGFIADAHRKDAGSG